MKFPPVVRFTLGERPRDPPRRGSCGAGRDGPPRGEDGSRLGPARTGRPRGDDGLACSTREPGGRSALALEDELATLGATVETAASWDDSTVSLFVPTARLAAALPLMSDVALRPDFPAKELDRLRKEALTSLLLARSEPGQIASRALSRRPFSARRTGTAVRAGGSAATIPAFTPEALRAFHAAHYRPGNAALIVVGDVTRECCPAPPGDDRSADGRPGARPRRFRCFRPR